MEYSAVSMLLDLMYACILLFIAKILREKIKIFQKLFIPVSLMAGFLELIFAQNGLGLFSFSDQFGSYSGLLIIMVFATIGLRGFNFTKGGFKSNAERIGGYFCFRNVGWAVQYSVPIIIGMFVLPMFAKDLSPAFGMLIPAGFQGGHGTSAALGETLNNLGWKDATDLAMTTATVGLLTSIFGGILFIKIATKKGYTSFVKDYNQLPAELQTGLMPLAKREDMGKETLAPIAFDPLAWHFVCVMIPTGIGYLLTQLIRERTGIGVPAFSVGFIIAIAASLFLKKTKMDDYIDKKVINRIGGTATDFLVLFGVASIKIPVVLKYFVPFVLLMLFGILWTAFHFWVLGPRMMKKDWFERGVFVYGYSAGVTAIGLSLLRIVDPGNQSTTLDDTAILAPFETIIEIAALAVCPVMIMDGKWYLCIVPIMIYAIILLLIPIISKWWYKGSKLSEERKEMI